MDSRLAFNGKTIELRMTITLNYPGWDVRVMVKRGDIPWQHMDELPGGVRNSLLNIVLGWIKANWR